MSLTERLIARVTRRPADFVVGGHERPYLLRWWLLPRNPVFNIYLHQFLRSDDDRAHHDHPWLFNISWIFLNKYIEHVIRKGGVLVKTLRPAGTMKIRFGAAPHRIELLPDDGCGEQPCWTLFITGPRVREWGFCCMERGWVGWREFTSPSDSGAVGKGCDQ